MDADDLRAVPGRFETIVIACPKTDRAPEPAAWQSELIYGAIAHGNVPAVPLAPVLIGAPPPSAPVHVRDQVAAFERDHPETKPWCLGLPLSALSVVDVVTGYLEVPAWIVRGRSSDELGADAAFGQVLADGLHGLPYDEGSAMAAVVITAPRALTHDLIVIPGDEPVRRSLAARLGAGRVGAVVAYAVGRVVDP